MTLPAAPDLTPVQQAVLDVWQKHVYAELAIKNVQDALDTMTEDAYVNNVPLLLGGIGKQGVREFYSQYFVAQMPPDMESTLISRTTGQDRIVEESVFRFTHSLMMDWFLPGVPSPHGQAHRSGGGGHHPVPRGQDCPRTSVLGSGVGAGAIGSHR